MGLQLETVGFVMASLATVTASGNKPLGVLSFLPRSMMSLGRSSAEFTFLWLLRLDPRLLRVDLRTVWSKLTSDTTVMAGR
jgi:hypothetical protein